MRYFFTLTSSNAKTGNIPQVYAQRSTCPPSCIHYGTTCYAEGFYTALNWRKADTGITLAELCDLTLKKFEGEVQDDGETKSAGTIFRDIAEAAGYDGVIMSADRHFGRSANGAGMKGLDAGTLHLAPFSSNQIKSAIGNNGEFDSASPDIRMSVAALDRANTPAFRAGSKGLPFVDGHLPGTGHGHELRPLPPLRPARAQGGGRVPGPRQPQGET